ncbi:hypothetical protein PENSUB_7750 [Penicillium subrubescens]|uniref:Uncharacterized protein n=1 Tax=Penicillium subrubescens TaxID=1316194 RepID=A0A1Q5TK53_9EURO|nr:hypothetical protein PENSUB_7750 [Penicillium subrubescens]
MEAQHAIEMARSEGRMEAQFEARVEALVEARLRARLEESGRRVVIHHSTVPSLEPAEAAPAALAGPPAPPPARHYRER